MEYRYNPELPIIRPNWQGNPYKDGAFQYLQDPFFPEWKTVLRMLMTPNPQRREKKADQWRPAILPSTDWIADKDRDFLVWLGHACFVIQLGGIRYITDPVLNGMPMVPRLVHPPFPTPQITGVDYILISHDHRDHCDQKSVQQLLSANPQAKIFTSLGMERTISKWIGDTPMQTAGWYQQFKSPSHEPQLTFLPTRHWSRRGLFDFNQVLWGAFLFEYQGKRHYFGGDSAYHWPFADTGEHFPDIDIAMLGIGAYAPDYMMQGAHMNPEEAVQAWQDLGAKRLLPMHYGTYDLSNEPASEPYRRIQKAMAEQERSHDLILPGVNEVVYL